MIEKQCKRHTDKLKQFVRLQVSIIVVIMLCGCGNKGELYLPDETNDTTTRQVKLNPFLAKQVGSKEPSAVDEANGQDWTINQKQSTFSN